MPSTQISHPRASANFTSCFAASQWKRERSCELKMTDWGSDHGQGLSCSGAGFQGREKRIKPGKKNKTRKKCSYGLRLLAGNYLIKNTKILSPTYHSLDFFNYYYYYMSSVSWRTAYPLIWTADPFTDLQLVLQYAGYCHPLAASYSTEHSWIGLILRFKYLILRFQFSGLNIYLNT